MIAMIPDCGVLSTPSRSSPLGSRQDGLKASPTPARTALSSPMSRDTGLASPMSSDMSGTSQDSGFSFGLYKSPKSNVVPRHRRTEPPPPPPRRQVRRPREGINKGVGHKIKRPKLKAKEKLKQPKQNVKAVARRLKEKKYVPCLPSNRSPVKPSSSPGVKKRRVLSSPGMSLLDEEASDSESFVPESKNGKFFTSRSRAAATVHIGKNIMLAAKYGDLTLKQREGTFTKKNIGRRVEGELNRYLKKSEQCQSMEEVLSLPSVQANPRPAPTRVASSPSPEKTSAERSRFRTSSAKKSKSANRPGVSNGGEQQDVDSLLDDWEEDEENAGEDSSARTECDASSSESGRTRSPSRQSPRKANQTGSPIRRSPRKTWRGVSPTRRSPRKSGNGASPLKESELPSSPRRSSPRKLANKSLKNQMDQSNGTSSAPKKVHSFFDPKTRLLNQTIPTRKTKRPNRRPRTLDRDHTQMVMDAGQKAFGARQCPECGVVYEVGNFADEASHHGYHDRVLSCLKFSGWKNERLARGMDHLGGRVVMVCPDDPPHRWRKVREVLEVVDEELGFSERGGTPVDGPVTGGARAFLYALGRRVAGCLLAETSVRAHRVVPREGGGGAAPCCSEATSRAWAGVSRLWVAGPHRGKGVASTLVDAMRDNMIRNHFLTSDEIAFSDPTESGMGFARRYTGRPDFLVYRR